MKELIEYRVKLVERLEQAAREFCDACRNIQDPYAQAGDEWNAHQIASHTRHVANSIYGARIQQTLREDDPRFTNFDEQTWMLNEYKKEEPLAEVLDEFLKGITDLCQTLRELPREAWSRQSWHELIGGGRTVQFWVERSLAHIEEHLNSVK
jgi:hypothetical protein